MKLWKGYFLCKYVLILILIYWDGLKINIWPKIILKKLKNMKIWVGTKNVRNPHILRTFVIFFLIFLKIKFFPFFLKELEVHIVFMNDDKIEYDPK